jgi:hypothetical protein
MNHSATTPASDNGGASKSTPVANPRRTQLGADGRPITGTDSDAFGCPGP